MDTPGHTYTTVVVGAGMAGLAMAARLKDAGEDSFVVLERAASIGGTWRDNTYPGAACDVQSHLYWYAGDRPDWSRLYARQPEILHHLEDFADRRGLHPHIRCNTRVASANWDEGRARWRVVTAEGTVYTARTLVTAWGQLSEPSYGDVPGRETFAGISTHTARWPRGLDPTGRRVAVIGSAASAVQVVPALAPDAGHLTVFQRSPNHILPRQDHALDAAERRALQEDPVRYDALRQSINDTRDTWAAALDAEENPVRAQFEELAARHLEEQVPDPVLRERLRPRHSFGCRRVLVSDDYYPALLRPDVSLVTEPVARIEPAGVRTADGRLHEADLLVHATGFRSLAETGQVHITGRGGLTLRDAWKEGPRAYLGITVSDFPNLFLLYGPNTNLGHHSVLVMIEAQIGYVLQALAALRPDPALSLDVRPDVLDAYDIEIQHRLTGTAFTSDCTSWYKTATGRISANWPDTVHDYQRTTGAYDPADYTLTRPTAPADL